MDQTLDKQDETIEAIRDLKRDDEQSASAFHGDEGAQVLCQKSARS